MESGLVGKSPSFLKALAAARRAAASCHPVFICGATGTGKEGVAALIHDHSPARRGPFVALNCSALPENLLEAELFGVEGKVPGMVFDKPLPGKFLLADGGTLFLDEISDLSATAQAKLLRVVETGRFFPVCGRSERSARVRLISAGQTPLRRLVEQQRFRSDLYYRLAVLEIHLPPLSQRAGDIPLLAEHFRARYCPGRRLSRQALDYLRSRRYAGNVRELETLFKRAGVWCDGEDILPEHFADAESALAVGDGDAAEAVLTLFCERERVSPREVRRLLGWPQSRARAALDDLLRQGRLERVGRGRNTTYIRRR